MKNHRSTAITATVNVDINAVNVEVKLMNLQRNVPNIQLLSNAAESVIGIDTHRTMRSLRPETNRCVDIEICGSLYSLEYGIDLQRFMRNVFVIERSFLC
jgi:hypothetical protein